MKKLRAGINKPLICKKCGHKLGFVKLKPRLYWKTLWIALSIALLFEFIANLIVYLIFNYGKS